ncbi:UNVERIFIED_CONTAM: hypothetical protein PYX00_009447 [Menopon gallinae]|uniref:Ribosomal protein S12 n=1 Tax=Menopon gallinae TaxID=328185 RepID=A0AAW2HBN6_9NEOP
MSGTVPSQGQQILNRLRYDRKESCPVRTKTVIRLTTGTVGIWIRTVATADDHHLADLPFEGPSSPRNNEPEEDIGPVAPLRKTEEEKRIGRKFTTGRTLQTELKHSWKSASARGRTRSRVFLRCLQRLEIVQGRWTGWKDPRPTLKNLGFIGRLGITWR